MGLLRSNPYRYLSVIMRYSNYSVSRRFTRWCAGRADLSSRDIGCFPLPGHGGRMIVVFYRSDGRSFVVWGRTHVFSLCVLSRVGSFCRVVCGGLERQSGTRLRYLLAITNRCRALPWLPQSWCMFVLYRCNSRRGVWA